MAESLIKNFYHWRSEHPGGVYRRTITRVTNPPSAPVATVHHQVTFLMRDCAWKDMYFEHCTTVTVSIWSSVTVGQLKTVCLEYVRRDGSHVCTLDSNETRLPECEMWTALSCKDGQLRIGRLDVHSLTSLVLTEGAGHHISDRDEIRKVTARITTGIRAVEWHADGKSRRLVEASARGDRIIYSIALWPSEKPDVHSAIALPAPK